MVSTKLAKSSVESNTLEYLKTELKVGDLVEFFSGAFFSNKNYSSSGIVVEVRRYPQTIPDSVARDSYKVIWSDGRETNEWRCYLKKLS